MFSLRMASRATRQAPGRTYATLREIETRLKSIKNIEKITNTMMVVAASRVGKACRTMDTARKYGSSAEELYKHAEVEPPKDPKKELLIILSSDKGLCGSIHTQLARAARKYLAANPNTDLVIVGDKAKAQMQRTNPEHIKLTFSGIGKEEPTFSEAALVADQIEQLDTDYDSVKTLYNRYVTSVSFQPQEKQVFSELNLLDAPRFSSYELEADDTSEHFTQFNLANFILWGLAEGHAAEIAARRSAMDNASKNANEMIGKYSILYNRTRQAVITNELVDIITGASSLS